MALILAEAAYLPVGGAETVGLECGHLEEHGGAAGVHLDSGRVQCSVYRCTPRLVLKSDQVQASRPKSNLKSTWTWT